jgi:hypothetical protein
MQRLNFRVGDAATNSRDPPSAALAMVERIHHRAVIRTMAGSLHHDISRNPEVIPKGEELDF